MSDTEHQPENTQENQEEVEQTKPGEKKLLNPKDSGINISNRRDARFYIFLSKIILKKFGHIELKAVGQAADTCVRVSENLERYSPLALMLRKVWIRHHREDLQ